MQRIWILQKLNFMQQIGILNLFYDVNLHQILKNLRISLISQTGGLLSAI